MPEIGVGSGQRVAIGITGASGALYATRTIAALLERGVHIELIVSDYGRRLLRDELGDAASIDRLTAFLAGKYGPGVAAGTFTLHSNRDLGATVASGSHGCSGMAIVPCSMRTLAAVVHGLGDNLIHRAADVILKERRKLLLAPREAPLSDIHLENMLKLSRMGVVICPPMPGFYQRPDSIDDLVNHSVVRMLDQFDIHLDAPGRWGEAFALGMASQPEDSEEF